MSKTSNGKTALCDIPANLPILIDANQAGAIANMSSKFIRDKCRDGSIKAVKCGRSWRINRDAFLEWLGL